MTYTILFDDKPFCCTLNHEHYINEALNKGQMIDRLKAAIASHIDIKLPIARFWKFEFSLATSEYDNWLETGGYVYLDVTTTQDRDRTSLFVRNLDIMSPNFAGDIAREIEKVVRFVGDEGPVKAYTRHRVSPSLDD